MKKTILIFVVSALVIVSVAIWALKGDVTGNIQEILSAAVIAVLVGFALFLGISRVQSRMRKEPAEDELSRKVMTKASSLAYYVSLYLWLLVMYESDKTSLTVDALVGTGILGMALAFLGCWLYVKAVGMKND